MQHFAYGPGTVIDPEVYRISGMEITVAFKMVLPHHKPTCKLAVEVGFVRTSVMPGIIHQEKLPGLLRYVYC